VSSNPAQARCTRYNFMREKFFSDLRQVGGFLRVHWFPSRFKLTYLDIMEILLKVALNTITLTH